MIVHDIINGKIKNFNKIDLKIWLANWFDFRAQDKKNQKRSKTANKKTFLENF